MGNTKSTEADNSGGEEKPEIKKKKEKDVPKASTCKEKSFLSSSQKEILKYSMTNAKEDLGQRIFTRVMDKRDDFRNFVEGLSKEERRELTDRLREFLINVVDNVNDAEEMDNLSKRFGSQHAQLRASGFKPDFFVGVADSMTTECVFLDGAAHGATECLVAWSQLTSQVFSAVRDGYYAELRRLRRLSTAKSTTEENPDQSKDADAVSSKSGEDSTSLTLDDKEEGRNNQLLAPPPSY
ncbi:unnamed protein product [Bursaphelenchus okinawaensis]|uniref:Globin family profile domain-containing protein n=1 Tax=Bursaphelenchus okinawaensis TaxID=465554 RepID=A0A811KJJ0_9BILA|nr:unnamed protein product [Bursaphelenchus okinawaensis]CAG9104132.1 unnamed protein product [Bursaphelenchus okinawaensis]